MSAQGTVRRWEADKGFGFIQGAGHSNVFFHIRDFRGPAAPAVGMAVEYEEIQVGGKGPRAMQVRPRSAQAARATAAKAANTRPGRATPRTQAAAQGRTRHASAPAPATGSGLAAVLMVLWLGLLAWGVARGALPLWLLGALAALNAATFLAYAIDKGAAQRGAWRISEKQLHLLALLGGWPAAWWAQQGLRHKSAKAEFRAVYWVTLLLNCAGLAALVWQPALAHPLLLLF